MKPTATYGMCSGPQNADAFAQSPVPVVEGKCDDSQTFSATSLGPSNGNGGCGGFTVAFGPKGNLRPYLDHVILRAEWGDVPLTAANCASARIATVGWGARCTGRADKTTPLTTACTSTKWEKIGGPTQGKVVWSTTSQVCSIGVQLSSVDKQYKTLTMDIIASVVENGQTVRKRAKGTIWVRQPNGQCLSAPSKPKRKE